MYKSHFFFYHGATAPQRAKASSLSRIHQTKKDMEVRNSTWHGGKIQEESAVQGVESI
jgi:hypothetical protein